LVKGLGEGAGGGKVKLSARQPQDADVNCQIFRSGSQEGGAKEERNEGRLTLMTGGLESRILQQVEKNYKLRIDNERKATNQETDRGI